MKKMLFMVLCAASLHAEQSFISKMYCLLLGNQDVKEKYSRLVHQALQTFDVSHAEDVPVKQMNKIGSLLAGTELSSFTAFGVWLNEESVGDRSAEERIFTFYHEAAHYALKHHQQLLKIIGGTSLFTAASLWYLHKKLTENGISHATALTLVSGLCSFAIIYAGILPYLVKYQEKQADIAAAQKLIAQDQSAIVQHRINYLETFGKDENSWWWSSAKEQVEYLSKILKDSK